MTKDEEGYNGWTNRETWATALHINNDQGLYNHRRELCRQAIKAAPHAPHIHTLKQATLYALEDSLKEWIEGMAEDVFFPDPPSEHLSDYGVSLSTAKLGMFHDIGSLWRVDWKEIATNFLSEYDD